MFLFGPATVTVDGVNLGDTYGGVSVALETKITYPLGGLPNKILTGASGTINLYKISAKTLGSDPQLNSGELIFEGSDYKITFYNAAIFIGDDFSTGTFDQQAVPLNFVAREDSSGNILKLE